MSCRFCRPEVGSSGADAPVRGDGRRRRGRRGQATSEYVSMLGIIVATMIACMALFVSPVAATYARLFRRMVLYLTSPTS
jgi:hypothetical protein